MHYFENVSFTPFEHITKKSITMSHYSNIFYMIFELSGSQHSGPKTNFWTLTWSGYLNNPRMAKRAGLHRGLDRIGTENEGWSAQLQRRNNWPRDHAMGPCCGLAGLYRRTRKVWTKIEYQMQ